MLKNPFTSSEPQKSYKQLSEEISDDCDAAQPRGKQRGFKFLLKKTSNNTRNIVCASNATASDQNESDRSMESTHEWNSDQESRIAYILKKVRKNSKDVEVIYNHIKKYPAFTCFVETCMTEVEDEAIRQICRHMSYERIAAGQWVIDPSNDKFYIILSGSVSAILSGSNVYAEQNLEAMEQENTNKGNNFENDQVIKGRQNDSKMKADKNYEIHQILANRENFSSQEEVFNVVSRKSIAGIKLSEFGRAANFQHKNGRLTANLHSVRSQITQNLHPVDSNVNFPARDANSNYHIISKVLLEGESFGERALTNSAEKRSASILANTDSEFITLNKEDFLKFFNRFSLQNKKKAEFFKANVPGIDQVSSRKILEDLLYSVQQIDFVKGNILTLEEGIGDKIFFLAEGCCMVKKNLEDTRHQNTDLKSKLKKNNIVLNEIGSGTIIGEELIFRPEKVYKYTVKVSSLHARLYYIKAAELKIKFPKETLCGLSKNFVKKEEMRNKRIEELRKMNTQNSAAQNGVSEQLSGKNQQDMIHSNNLESSPMSREFLAFSRNYNKIQLQLNQQFHKTIEDYNMEYTDSRRPYKMNTQRSVSVSLDAKKKFSSASKHNVLRSSRIAGKTDATITSEGPELIESTGNFFGLTATKGADSSIGNHQIARNDTLLIGDDDFVESDQESIPLEKRNNQSQRSSSHSRCRNLSLFYKTPSNNKHLFKFLMFAWARLEDDNHSEIRVFCADDGLQFLVLNTFNEDRLSKSVEHHKKKLELIKVENPQVISDGLSRFDFGSTNLDENAKKAKKNFVPPRISQAGSGIRREKTPQLQRSESSFFSFLRAATPGRERLFKDLGVEFRNIGRITGSTPSRLTYSNDPILEIDLTKTGFTNCDFFKSQKNETLKLVDQNAATPMIESGKQNPLFRTSPSNVKFNHGSKINENCLTESTQISSLRDSHSNIQDIERVETARKRFGLHREQVKFGHPYSSNLNGTSHSLKLKRDLRQALDSKRMRQAWKDSFVNNKTLNDDSKSIINLTNCTIVKD